MSDERIDLNSFPIGKLEADIGPTTNTEYNQLLILRDIAQSLRLIADAVTSKTQKATTITVDTSKLDAEWLSELKKQVEALPGDIMIKTLPKKDGDQ